MWVFLLMMSLLLCPAAVSTARTDAKPGCQDKCGNVSVPYPFGIREESCAMNKHFFLNCTSGADGQPQLLFGTNMPVRKISQPNGTVTVGVYPASDCYNETASNWTESSVTLGSGPFMFSDTRNVFTVIGCDTYAWITNYEDTYGVGCQSFCTENVNMSDGNPCVGSGCCQTSISKGLKSLNISTYSNNSHTNVLDFNPCGIALLVDRSSLKLSDWPLSRNPEYGNDVYTDAVIEWVVKNETCKQAKADSTSAYACGSNANCTYSENQGYRCLCKEGFEGNPYLPDGCQDIDECKVRGKNACEEGTCENVIGDYKCRCPLGKYGDGKTGCKGVGIIAIIAAAGASIFLVVICLLLYMICTKRIKEKNFQENGGKILKNQRVRIFSEAELAKATNNYADDRKLGEGGFGSVYSGVLTDNTVVAVNLFEVA